ncbi:MAG: hypothetical protein JWR09_841, partial [Mucilaginibacter sp.]|nr:hypothetical protein [Mucilaginibacter sp.]
MKTGYLNGQRLLRWSKITQIFVILSFLMPLLELSPTSRMMPNSYKKQQDITRKMAQTMGIAFCWRQFHRCSEQIVQAVAQCDSRLGAGKG